MLKHCPRFTSLKSHLVSITTSSNRIDLSQRGRVSLQWPLLTMANNGAKWPPKTSDHQRAAASQPPLCTMWTTQITILSSTCLYILQSITAALHIIAVTALFCCQSIFCCRLFFQSFLMNVRPLYFCFSIRKTPNVSFLISVIKYNRVRNQHYWRRRVSPSTLFAKVNNYPITADRAPSGCF